MISLIEGFIDSIDETSIVVKTNGFGFIINVADPKLYHLNEEIILYIFFHFSSDNGPSLFGFKDKFEREMFKLIISCQGFGPKIALSFFKKISASNLYDLIKNNNLDEISCLPGIGKKKAESLVLNLKDKINKIILDKKDIYALSRIEIIDTLKNLNYSSNEINKAIEYINENFINKDNLDIKDIIKDVILYLSK